MYGLDRNVYGDRMKYKLTEHVKQRYAERIMDREEKIDILTFVNKHQEKIFTDIEKMIEYGEIIYEGVSTKDYNKSVVQVVLNGCWILILDPKKETVVTLFEIDLGLGKEFNEEYIGKLLAKLRDAKARYNEKVAELDQRVKGFNELIDENDEKIREYRAYIKSLEQQNSNMVALITENNNNKSMAEQEVREIIGSFVGKKVF